MHAPRQRAVLPPVSRNDPPHGCVRAHIIARRFPFRSVQRLLWLAIVTHSSCCNKRCRPFCPTPSRRSPHSPSSPPLNPRPHPRARPREPSFARTCAGDCSPPPSPRSPASDFRLPPRAPMDGPRRNPPASPRRATSPTRSPSPKSPRASRARSPSDDSAARTLVQWSSDDGAHWQDLTNVPVVASTVEQSGTHLGALTLRYRARAAAESCTMRVVYTAIPAR